MKVSGPRKFEASSGLSVNFKPEDPPLENSSNQHVECTEPSGVSKSHGSFVGSSDNSNTSAKKNQNFSNSTLEAPTDTIKDGGGLKSSQSPSSPLSPSSWGLGMLSALSSIKTGLYDVIDPQLKPEEAIEIPDDETPSSPFKNLLDRIQPVSFQNLILKRDLSYRYHSSGFMNSYL